jgi:ubiquinone/menaquinone biosynthesis C-methylase UbiE
VATVGARLFARVYDVAMAGPESAGLRSLRQGLLTAAEGRVLEIGAGSGANIPFYSPAVETLTLTEPEVPMLRRLRHSASLRAPSAIVLRAPAEDLPFDDDSFDVVVSTLVLCTVDDQPRTLRQVRRILAPRGRLLFIEHVYSDEPRLRRWQDRLNGLNRILGHGCECNRATLDSILAAGFTLSRLQRETLHRVPPIVRPLLVGCAESTKGSV